MNLSSLGRGLVVLSTWCQTKLPMHIQPRKFGAHEAVCSGGSKAVGNQVMQGVFFQKKISGINYPASNSLFVALVTNRKQALTYEMPSTETTQHTTYATISLSGADKKSSRSPAGAALGAGREGAAGAPPAAFCNALIRAYSASNALFLTP